MKLILTAIFSIVTASIGHAQFLDSLNIKVGSIATVASEDHQPLWLVANRFGTIADRGSDLSTNIRISNIHKWGNPSRDTLNPYYFTYGVDLYNNNHFNQSFFKEAFIKAGYKNWQIRAGRFEEITGDIDQDLSSGSLGISGNSLPIPKVGIVVTDYTNVPFTNGFLQFKGQFSHGWFGNNRYMKNALLHEKTFYMRLGKKRFKLYGGIQHFAEWGGRRGNVQLERSFKGFLDVMFVREADDGSVGTSVNGILPNRPGDQRGLLEAGFTWENDNTLLRGYQQTPFETGRDVDIRNIDRLIGLTYQSKNSGSIIKKIVGEILSTKDMLSFVEQSDRQSYYNNGFYKTGWEYQDRIVGTPLFINRQRASKYFSDVKAYNWDNEDNIIFGNDNIINNRIVGAHFGIMYSLLSKFNAKTLLTYTRNYGTHGLNKFSPHKDQLYTLQQFNYITRTSGLSLLAAIGFDSGDLSNNVGFMLGIQKEFNRHNKIKF